MAFASSGAFLAMGGYAQYVWPVWGMALLLLVGSIISARGRRRRLLAQIKRQQRQAGAL